MDKKEIKEGVKTFFVVPDLSLMPEEFIASFFLRGFQVYYVMDDPYLDIPSKIRALISVFPDLIVFFNTERRLSGVDWPAFIRELRKEGGEGARIGVLYGKHQGAEARSALERAYLGEIGVQCGCVSLEYSKAKNLSLLMGALDSNEARGRRKSLRAICGESCAFNFEYEGRIFRGRIRDVSVSHFSCCFDGPEPELKLYEKVGNMQLKLGGSICTVDGVLFSQRDFAGRQLDVFVFRTAKDRDGLDPKALAKVNAYIQGHYEQAVRSMIRAAYDEEIARRRAKPAPARLDAKGSAPP